MKKLAEILDEVKNGTLSVEIAHQQILNLKLFDDSVSLPKIEEPILVGYLNKIFGYNGFNKIEIGSPVYEFKDRYYFEMTPINGGKIVIQKFYKESLRSCINFI